MAFQDGTESPKSWIHRLPLDIRTDIAQRAARDELAWREPIPVTRADLHITDLVLVNETLAPEYRLRASRTREQHVALQTWVTLCSKARAAALSAEVFVLTVLSDPPKVIRSVAEQRNDTKSQPQLPLYEGAARDLVLNFVDSDANVTRLFTTLRAVFGDSLRRIHVLEDEYNDTLVGMTQIASTQTSRVYFFHPRFGKPDLGMERILTDTFHSSGELLEGKTNKLGFKPREGEFNDQDAKVFELPSLRDAWRHQGRQSRDPTLCYGEIIRQYGNGETKINKGVNAGLAEEFNGCPSAAAKSFLQKVVGLAETYFPKLEYVSLCGPISNAALEAQYQKYQASASSN